MSDATGRSRWRLLRGSLLIGALVLLWILAVAPSAGPDEPSHLVRSAALVRGDLSSERRGPVEGFDVSATTSWPPPNCFAFNEFIPASCATTLPVPEDAEVFQESRADDYPIWGHLLPGLGTLAPGETANMLARVLDAAVPVVLVAASLLLAARRGWLSIAGVLLAVTPLAWFSFAVVNPSGLVIAGGIAMWTAISTSSSSPDRTRRWLVAIGFAAMSLPRRDGFVWAGASVAIALLWSGVGLRDAWRLLGPGPRIVVAGSTLATMAYAVSSESRSTIGLVLVPALPLAAVALRSAWRWAQPRGPVAVAGVATVSIVGAAGAALAVMSFRPGGFDREVLRIIINRTGLRLEGAVGTLGWLDTPIPSTMMLLWFVALGALVAGAVLAGDLRRVVVATTVVAAAIVGSWVLEMTQGDPTGTYYQGRYYLPFLAAVPIVVATVRPRHLDVERLGWLVAAAAAVLVNVSFAAAMRRWGVGNAGPWVPWAWDTYGTALPTTILLVLHVAVTGAIGWWLVDAVRAGTAATADPDGADAVPVS